MQKHGDLHATTANTLTWHAVQHDRIFGAFYEFLDSGGT
jgi:hypothetical protein